MNSTDLLQLVDNLQQVCGVLGVFFFTKEIGLRCLNYLTRYLLLGGRMGHLAAFDWKDKKLRCEFHVQETVRDVR